MGEVTLGRRGSPMCAISVPRWAIGPRVPQTPKRRLLGATHWFKVPMCPGLEPLEDTRMPSPLEEHYSSSEEQCRME